MLRCRACRASFQTLAGMLPHPKKRPGVPICQLVLPGCSSFRGLTPSGTPIHTTKAHMSMCSYVFALVPSNKQTRLKKHSHIHPHAQSGCVAEVRIQCQCSVLSPPTSGWSPCQFTCQGWTSRALSAPERAPSPPPIHTHHFARGQGGFTPVCFPPSIVQCQPTACLL